MQALDHFSEPSQEEIKKWKLEQERLYQERQEAEAKKIADIAKKHLDEATERGPLTRMSPLLYRCLNNNKETLHLPIDGMTPDGKYYELYANLYNGNGNNYGYGFSSFTDPYRGLRGSTNLPPNQKGDVFIWQLFGAQYASYTGLKSTVTEAGLPYLVKNETLCSPDKIILSYNLSEKNVTIPYYDTRTKTRWSAGNAQIRYFKTPDTQIASAVFLPPPRLPGSIMSQENQHTVLFRVRQSLENPQIWGEEHKHFSLEYQDLIRSRQKKYEQGDIHYNIKSGAEIDEVMVFSNQIRLEDMVIYRMPTIPQLQKMNLDQLWKHFSNDVPWIDCLRLGLREFIIAKIKNAIDTGNIESFEEIAQETKIQVQRQVQQQAEISRDKRKKDLLEAPMGNDKKKKKKNKTSSTFEVADLFGGGSKQKRRNKSKKSRRNTLKKRPRKTLKKRSRKRSTKRH
jgi:hypothetical protein